MRRRVGGLALLCAVTLAGCTTTVAGTPVMAPIPDDSDGAIVALLDTGTYRTTPDKTPGVADDGGAYFEGQRMAEYVVGPWMVDKTLRSRGGYNVLFKTIVVGPGFALAQENIPQWLKNVANAHNFISGFASYRVKESSQSGSMSSRSLQNVVLRFPGPDQAKIAAAEMVEKLPGALPFRELPIPDRPTSVAKGYQSGGNGYVESFTAYGPYVLYQSLTVESNEWNPYPHAASLISSILQLQQTRLDHFQPTDPAKLGELPKDPTGELFPRVLKAIDGNIAGMSAGVWRPTAWLHFVDDPIAAEVLFENAGVEWVTQILTTVYQTGDRGGAATLAQGLAAAMKATPYVKTIDGVAGLPRAKCFERTRGAAPAEAAESQRRVAWHFKCVAQAGRYAFTAYSTDATDVKQQISAQYRKLAGE